MNNWLKIANNTFYVKECDVQLSFEKWAILYLTLDISMYPKYYDDFINIYDGRKCFDISTVKFAAQNCRIKTMDIDFGKKISLSIRCENLDTHHISNRRDAIIDDILGDKTTFIIIKI
jgi:hypothetical protein